MNLPQAVGLALGWAVTAFLAALALVIVPWVFLYNRLNRRPRFDVGWNLGPRVPFEGEPRSLARILAIRFFYWIGHEMAMFAQPWGLDSIDKSRRVQALTRQAEARVVFTLGRRNSADELAAWRRKWGLQ